MSPITSPRLALLRLSSGLALAALLSPVLGAESKEVKCGSESCGTMEISQYDKYQAGNATGGVGGVTIKGEFKPTKKGTYHYLQAINADNSDAQRLFKDTSVALPVPHLDTPPGGYMNQTFATGVYNIDDHFDTLPWYDEAGDSLKFPGFYDQPSRLLQRAKAKDITFQFETWLVCVIDEVPGSFADQAKDDKYTVAPLIGFSWGFGIAYKDVGVIGTDELADFTITVTPFAWVAAPSGDWKKSLDAVYGSGAKEDRFNITLGDCKDCVAPVPEPQVAWLLLPGLLLVVWRRRGSLAA